MTQLPAPVLSPPLLLATDGSPSAAVAGALIRPIAELFAAPTIAASPVVTVVTVQPRPPKRFQRSLKKAAPHPVATAATDATGTIPPESTSAIAPVPPPDRPPAGLSQTQLQDWVEGQFAGQVPVAVEVRQGRPTTEILNCARSLNAGLIAVGHRGVGGVREMLLGSVSTAIARYAPCSVLIARSRGEAPVGANWQHILLVIEHSRADQQALAVTRQLATVGIQTITVVYVQPTLNATSLVSPMVARTPSWQLNQSLQDAQREQGEHILQAAVAALDLPQLPIQTHLQTGDAGPSICQLAETLGVNLILIGSDSTRRSLLSPLQSVRLPRRKPQVTSPARPVLRNTRLSVTEDYVIHYAPCPVMLCRGMTATP